MIVHIKGISTGLGTLVIRLCKMSSDQSYRIVNKIVPHVFSSLCLQYFGFIVFVSVGDQHTLPVAKRSPIPRHAVQKIVTRAKLCMPPKQHAFGCR